MFSMNAAIFGTKPARSGDVAAKLPHVSLLIIIIIIIINFKLRVGFHPVAVALKRHTNKT
jgi:hypothetical protein